MSLIMIFQYVDPGTGALLTQLLFSFLIGVGFYLLTVRKRLMSFFKRQHTDKPADPSASTQENKPRGE